MDPTTPPVQQPEAPKYNHPCGDLLVGRDYFDIAVPLYRASIKGYWLELDGIIKHSDHLLRCSITKNQETALHIAAMGQSTWFLEQLVNRMSKEDMALQNGDGNTPLSLAAISGNVVFAKIILEKDPSMLTTRGYKDMICLAALHGNYEMVAFLYHELHQFPLDPAWSDNDWYQIFLNCIEADLFDVALQILNEHTKSVVTPRDKECIKQVLQALAQKPNAFHDIHPHPIKKIFTSPPGVDIQPSKATQLLRKFLEQIVIDLGHDIDDIFTDSDGILFAAAEIGNAKFLIELFYLFPDLIWKINSNEQTVFHIAVRYRHKSIYNLLYEIGSMKDMITRLIDKYGNNMLHLAAEYRDNKSLEEFSGEAYQMRHEMLWFKEVEAMVPPSYKKMRNRDGYTPQELFTREHKSLCSNGEKWIKSTVNQSMVAAALISTIGFSVAFSIPGGYNQNTGFPIFHRNKVFITYVVLDALSFILSSVSILMFLSIMTYHYYDVEFLEILLFRLLFGQATLLLSIFATMAAFSVSFFVTFHNNLPIFICLLTSIPVVLFAGQQYFVITNVTRSAYAVTHIFQTRRHTLNYKNPRF